MERNGAIWMIGEFDNWCVPGDFRGGFYFCALLPRYVYYYRKSITKHQIIKKFPMHRNAVRNISQ